MRNNHFPGNAPGLPDVIDFLDEAFLLCDLIHMALKSLPEYERDTLHAGIDRVSDRVAAAKRTARDLWVEGRTE